MSIFNSKNEKGVKKTGGYMSGKEIREIAKANAKEMRRLEKEKKRKAAPSEYTTQLKNSDNILEVENLHSYFFTDQGVVKAVNGVSYNVPKNSIVGVVGESGCGKSTLGYSLMNLIENAKGEIYFEDRLISNLKKRELKLLRKDIQIIFQDPYSSLNPRLA